MGSHRPPRTWYLCIIMLKCIGNVRLCNLQYLLKIGFYFIFVLKMRSLNWIQLRDQFPRWPWCSQQFHWKLDNWKLLFSDFLEHLLLKTCDCSLGGWTFVISILYYSKKYIFRIWDVFLGKMIPGVKSIIYVTREEDSLDNWQLTNSENCALWPPSHV